MSTYKPVSTEIDYSEIWNGCKSGKCPLIPQRCLNTAHLSCRGAPWETLANTHAVEPSLYFICFLLLSPATWQRARTCWHCCSVVTSKCNAHYICALRCSSCILSGVATDGFLDVCGWLDGQLPPCCGSQVQGNHISTFSLLWLWTLGSIDDVQEILIKVYGSLVLAGMFASLSRLSLFGLHQWEMRMRYFLLIPSVCRGIYSWISSCRVAFPCKHLHWPQSTFLGFCGLILLLCLPGKTAQGSDHRVCSLVDLLLS